jgi:hypothetical protein
MNAPTMTENQRLQLQNMIQANSVEDQTELIRKLKHSAIFRTEIERMQDILDKHKGDEMRVLEECIMEANFLYTYYTDLFHKIRKEEINLDLLSKFLDILQQIENGETDQHTASFMVGTILKQIYVDSALKRGEKLDKLYNNKKEEVQEVVPISWKEYKTQGQQIQVEQTPGQQIQAEHTQGHKKKYPKKQKYGKKG